MSDLYQWPWVESQVEATMTIWNACANPPLPAAPLFSPEDQQRREAAYDDALAAVELELTRARRRLPNSANRLATQQQITAVFARFSALALGLEDDAIHILTHQFLPVGATLAQWARRFDPTLPMPGIIQACRNAWTACGLQPLLGEPIHITPAIAAYSMLYPYTDNFLDRPDIASADKLFFSRRFHDRLDGLALTPLNPHESALWTMVSLIEEQFPRDRYPDVFTCLLAIHRAQVESISQLENSLRPSPTTSLLRLSCAKGGTSVLADACLGRGSLTPDESRFAFEWGVLLQLGDDLQDIAEDLDRGSHTLFSRAALEGQPLDSLVRQLLEFSERVGNRMESLARLPGNTAQLRHLLRMSWRSLILGAVAQSHQHFTPEFLAEAEQSSHFRFAFLRARRERLAASHGLYNALFQLFLEPETETAPASEIRRTLTLPDTLTLAVQSSQAIPS
jgi:hypothetical protein